MKKLNLLPLISILIFFSSTLLAQFNSTQTNYTGSYLLNTGQVTMTLTLNQASEGTITGTLKSTTGISYNIKGQLEEGIAMGICSNDESGVYFEASVEGVLLILKLIEPDQFNMPDYSTAKYLSFEKQMSNQQINQPSTSANIIEGLTGTQGNRQPMTVTSNVAVSILSNESGDLSWGFKFPIPGGWTVNKTSEVILMGHNTIPGLILLIPHMSATMQEVQQELINGFQEDGVSLMLLDHIQTIGQNIAVGDYSGIFDGQQVKARGVGTLSPHGGGTYIIAVTTPEKYGQDLINSAESISRSIQYFKPDIGDMVQHFAGQWTHFTSNTTTWIYLYPNGIYSEQYESAYAGDLSGGGNWSAMGQDQSAGRWTVRGNKEQGQIIIKLNNGREIVYNYKVYEEKGEKFYWEYLFNGTHYRKSKIE